MPKIIYEDGTKTIWQNEDGSTYEEPKVPLGTVEGPPMDLRQGSELNPLEMPPDVVPPEVGSPLLPMNMPAQDHRQFERVDTDYGGFYMQEKQPPPLATADFGDMTPRPETANFGDMTPNQYLDYEGKPASPALAAEIERRGREKQMRAQDPYYPVGETDAEGKPMSPALAAEVAKSRRTRAEAMFSSVNPWAEKDQRVPDSSIKSDDLDLAFRLEDERKKNPKDTRIPAKFGGPPISAKPEAEITPVSLTEPAAQVDARVPTAAADNVWGQPLPEMKLTPHGAPGMPRSGGRTHRGYDYVAKEGEPIKAWGPGTIVAIGPSEKDGGKGGNRVITEYANGTQVDSMHMKGFNPELKVGDKVDKDTVLGYVGTTGTSGGPHLHEQYKSTKGGEWGASIEEFKEATGITTLPWWAGKKARAENAALAAQVADKRIPGAQARQPVEDTGVPPPYVTDPQNYEDFIKSTDYHVQKHEAAIQKAADATMAQRTAMNEAEGAALAARQKQVKLNQQAEGRRQERLDGLQKKYQESIDRVNKMEVNPNKVWEDSGTLNSIIAGISVAIGGMLALKYNRRNDALDTVNNIIKNSIEAQRANIYKAQNTAQMQGNLYNDNMRRFGDQRAAEAATLVQMDVLAAQQVKAVAGRYENPITQANADVLLQQLQEQKQLHQEDLFKMFHGMANQDELLNIQKGKAAAEQAKAEKENAPPPTVGGDAHIYRINESTPTTGKIPEPDAKLMVGLGRDKKDGLPITFVAPSEDAKKKLSTTVTALKAYTASLDKLLAMRKEYGWEPTSQIWKQSEEGQVMMGLYGDMIASLNPLRLGGGVLREGDIDFAKNEFLGPDPTKWSLGEGTIPQLKQTGRSVVNAINAQLETDGYIGPRVDPSVERNIDDVPGKKSRVEQLDVTKKAEGSEKASQTKILYDQIVGPAEKALNKYSTFTSKDYQKDPKKVAGYITEVDNAIDAIVAGANKLSEEEVDAEGHSVKGQVMIKLRSLQNLKERLQAPLPKTPEEEQKRQKIRQERDKRIPTSLVPPP